MPAQRVEIEALQGVDIVPFRDAAEWESWLERHHDRPAGVWLKLAKKGSGTASVTEEEVLDAALCYGWISGQRRAYDATYFLQKYSPRRPKSLWSKINVDKVEALVAAGRMRAPGLREVEAAKADGRWAAAYASQKNATIPADLAVALKRSAAARRQFESLSKTNRYIVVLRLMTARTPDNRAARLQRMITRLEEGKTIR